MYYKTIIIGRLNEDPTAETTHTSGGKCAHFAVSNSTIDRETGEEIRQSYPVRALGKQAELVCQHLRKGDLVWIEGSLVGGYINGGPEGTAPTIVVERVVFLSSKARKRAAEVTETEGGRED